MHVSSLKLWNFRKFGGDAFDLIAPHLEVGFSPGLNVLIGENDSGKTAIIDAVRLVLKTHSYDWSRVDGDDFHKSGERLRIELTLSGLKPEEGKNFTEFLCWEDDKEEVRPFLRLILDVRKNPATGQILPYEVRAGGDADGKQLSPEAKEYLKVTYLKPLRDAEEELVARKNSRLSQILIGHEAFKGKGEGHVLMDHLKSFNLSLENYFEGNDHAGEPIDDQLGKGLKDSIDGYIKQLYQQGKKTGLSVTERGQLKGLLEKLELSILGETRPGLGTLNRLFMASELLHLNKLNWTGIRLGLVEELEAHLHPQAQMQAIETLQKQTEVQLMLTTHSPNIGSKLDLKNLIVCNGSKAYPMGGEHTELDADDYVFLERFLDVTKANLFFSKGVILVEGWSEELFLGEFARLLGYDLTEKGVAVVNVSSLAFIRYANVFKRKAEPHFEIPVAVLTDVDVPFDEEDGTTPGDKANLAAAITAKQKKYDGQCVRSFISPRWTLEYCLSKSNAFKAKFAEIVMAAHNRTDWTDFDATLADKLKRQALAKTEISARLAQALSKGEIKKEQVAGDVHVEYLVKAIEYACGN
ncbi:ATP-dependent nuclease [Duganella levis]|uniref:AAA family ATPase n=1 Tax=Duganella levis TaxID=2692169 RepID=A0ABW9VZ85_9BURK|nr:AAA family ATPase [Duganella levis]MYN26973.1 AAA family ATPase [Duganella levis]